ncbi:MAG: 30S ribosomal protein S6 [Bacillota bacterium]|nr:30S ribosomal protein S6 [Thermoanaerobacteraceae bacterium]
MRRYETMFILRPGLEQEALDAAVERFKGVLEEQGGTVERIDRWGKRRLAYEIAKEKEGYYVVMDFQAEPPAVKELDRVFKLSGNVLRHLIILRD